MQGWDGVFIEFKKNVISPNHPMPIFDHFICFSKKWIKAFWLWDQIDLMRGSNKHISSDLRKMNLKMCPPLWEYFHFCFWYWLEFYFDTRDQINICLPTWEIKLIESSLKEYFNFCVRIFSFLLFQILTRDLFDDTLSKALRIDSCQTSPTNIFCPRNNFCPDMNTYFCVLRSNPQPCEWIDDSGRHIYLWNSHQWCLILPI